MNVLPSIIKKFLKKIFGEGLINSFGKMVSYIFFSRNPIILMFYVVLMGGSLFIFFRDLYPIVIDSPVLGKVHGFVYIPIIFVLLVFSFLKAALTDPGTINKQNVESYLELYPYDNQLFFPRECETCKIMKPARSKHCRFLNKCVARYDHYCAWLMNSVGEQNYRWFLLFLFSNSLVCCYGAYILFKFLYSQIQDDGLITDIFYDNKGNEIETGFKFYLSYLVYYQRGAVLLFFMAIIMGFVVIAFFFFQLVFISNNITSNESYKMADLRHYIKNKKKQIQHSKKNTQKTLKKETSSDHKDQKTKYKKNSKNEIQNNIKNIKASEKKIEINQYDDVLLKIDPNNIKSYYHKGFWKNFLEILFPLANREKKIKKIK
ncbi:palmitoyltransferase swf1 [Anaeramoeba flamelloides]|uniref:Palmitoyltransferase n=1 Tax=Anaeramoeba flamelloides TaxID=1746091 RepID=A0AAV7YA20_9EUKA|nr:palmitoyltransferase swf1 [Anaeramoeba flamelloides]